MAQRRAFEIIAINLFPRCRPATIDALVARGLVTVQQRQIARDRFGPIMVPDYSVPPDIHRQWCAWCAEQP